MSHKTDIELIVLKHVLHCIRNICEDGITSKDDPSFYAEPAPEDCLLLVKKMVKKRKKYLKAAADVPPLKPGESVDFLHSDGSVDTFTGKEAKKPKTVEDVGRAIVETVAHLPSQKRPRKAPQ